MECKDTLRIKHLPKELTDSQKEDFVRHFGAYKVKVITSKAKAKSIVYAKFESEDVAKNVMLRLHQINVLNCRLSVEYADSDILQGQPSAHKVEDSREAPDKKFLKNFINNINAFNDSVGFYQPPPSHLRYNYPKANRPTINNIAHALATVPRFYTQVLHLMNKMNLPPPFAMPEPPVRTIPAGQTPQRPIPTNSDKRKKESSSESELESDGEGKTKEIIPEKRQVAPKKGVKRPKFIRQPVAPLASKPAERPENVFEKVEVQLQKVIKLNVPQDSVSEKCEEVKESSESVVPEEEEEEVAKEPSAESVIEPEKTEVQLPSGKTEIEKPEEEQSKPDNPRSASPEDDFPRISREELAANQITDLTVLPVFKNYSPGDPTNKLYIKNCAKSVIIQDLEYIYNRYREEPPKGQPSEFNIRLMQEGRMKGQAFVTLDSVEQAQRAVKETNGFILKDKPLIVVFGKAGKKN